MMKQNILKTPFNFSFLRKSAKSFYFFFNKFLVAVTLAALIVLCHSTLNTAAAERKLSKKAAADNIRDLQALIDDQSKPALITASEPKWKPVPLPLPSGAEYTVLEGDPNQPGPFLMRIKLPANYKIPAHWSLSDEHITVLSGVLHIGIGDKQDEEQAKVMPAGSFARIPAKTNHYDFASEETIVQYHGVGPWGIEYLNPDETPSGVKGLTGMNGQLNGESKDEQTSYITSPGALELRNTSDLETISPASLDNTIDLRAADNITLEPEQKSANDSSIKTDKKSMQTYKRVK
jgi:hypothetical protein